MKLVNQKWVPMQPLKLYSRMIFSFPWIFHQKIEMLPVEKCPMGPNLHISKMATIHTAKMLIAITQ